MAAYHWVLWLTSPAGWLPRTRISSGTLRLVIEYGLPLPFLCIPMYTAQHCVKPKHHQKIYAATNVLLLSQLVAFTARARHELEHERGQRVCINPRRKSSGESLYIVYYSSSYNFDKFSRIVLQCYCLWISSTVRPLSVNGERVRPAVSVYSSYQVRYWSLPSPNITHDQRQCSYQWCCPDFSSRSRWCFIVCLQCFDERWLGGRKIIRRVKKLGWWGTGMVIGLEQDADLYMAQLMPLPLTVSRFRKIQIGFTFLVLAHSG